MADKNFDLDEFEDMISDLERKNDALVDYLKTIISDAEFLLRKLGER